MPAGLGPEHDYVLFDPGPWHFPPPRLPVLPLLPLLPMGPVWPVLRGHSGQPGAASPLWADQEHRLYAKARYALHDAFAVCGVGASGTLLAPAYHCRSMIDPALALGARVAFFNLTPRLEPDLDHVSEQLRASPVPVRAVLMPHYFGRVQDLKPLATLCRQHGAQLIEDCAHALPVAAAARGMGHLGHMGNLGQFGDWCISSPYKFFACPDGGVLWSGTGRPLPADLPRLRSPGLHGQLSRLWRRLARPGRGAPAPVADDQKAAPVSSPERASLALQARRSGPSSDYDSHEEQQACSASSRWLVAHTDINTLLRRRRENYHAWAAAARSFRHAQALAPELAGDDTPYMFPLLLDAPVEHFALIKRAGVPVYRWDSLALSGCAVSAGLRLRLLHLPCHQSLRPGDLAWMMDTVRSCLNAVPAARPA